MLLSLDQITKHFARVHFQETFQIIPFIKFKFAENPGIAFSWQVPYWILIPVILFMIIFLTHQLLTKDLKKLEITSYLLILSGAVGNLIDRILFQKVTDFISIGNFPVFNVADSCITLGVAVLLYQEFRKT